MVKLSKEEFLARMAKGKKDAAKGKKKSKGGGKSIKKDMTKCVKCKKIEPKTASEKRLAKTARNMGLVIVHYCSPCARKFLRPPKK